MIFFSVSLHELKKHLVVNKITICVFTGILFFLNSVKVLSQSRSIDSLETILKTYKQVDTIKVNLLNTIGYKYWIIDANASISNGKEALELSKTLDYTTGIAKANRIIGVAYWSQGHQNKALTYLNTSYKVYKNLKDKTGIANTTLNIGMVYSDLKDYKKALSHYEQAINEFTALGLKSRIATTFTKIGTLHLEQYKDEEALQYLTDALQMHIDSDFTYGTAEVHNRLAKLYLNKNEIEQASYHVKKSMVLGDKVNDIHGLTNNLIINGKILRLSNNIDKAIVEVEKGLILAKENKLKQYELLAYDELKVLKQKQYKSEEALQFYDKYSALKDSLFNSEKAKQIAYLEFENELERKDKKLLKLEAQEKRDKLIKYALILGFAVLTIAGYIIFTISRQRAKKSKQLVAKNQEHIESVHALTQKNLENSELKRQQLREQLDFKNKELTSYTLNFIKKNEVVQQLQQTIDKVKKSNTIEKDKLVTDLNKIIRKNLSIDKDWENFSRFFEDVHQGFYSKLKSKHKDLTTNDLKICSLIRLNLNIKETASILGISPESVKTARYRLRKKLELDSKQEIFAYLVSLEQL